MLRLVTLGLFTLLLIAGNAGALSNNLVVIDDYFNDKRSDEKHEDIRDDITSRFDLKLALISLLVKEMGFDSEKLNKLLEDAHAIGDIDDKTKRVNVKLLGNYFNTQERIENKEGDIYNFDEDEIYKIFPSSFIETEKNGIEPDPDFSIRDIKIAVANGIDPTLDPIDIYITHGTWNSKNPFLELKNFEKLAFDMSIYHRRPVRLFSTTWNGELSKEARKRASDKAVPIIRQLKSYYSVFMGYSNGVNFLNMVSMGLPPFKVLLSIALARPNLDSICEQQQAKKIPFVIDLTSRYDTITPLAETWEWLLSFFYGPCCKENEVEEFSIITSTIDYRNHDYPPSHPMTLTVIQHLPKILKEMLEKFNHKKALQKLSLNIVPDEIAEENSVNTINLTLTESMRELPLDIKETHNNNKKEYEKVYKKDVREEDGIFTAIGRNIYNFFESIGVW